MGRRGRVFWVGLRLRKISPIIDVEIEVRSFEGDNSVHGKQSAVILLPIKHKAISSDLMTERLHGQEALRIGSYISSLTGPFLGTVDQGVAGT